ncbi:MAG TPA: ATP synthase subunit I [Azospirillum sp.]|nr:ATP synthase subunit I [Azospirillum sp.]
MILHALLGILAGAGLGYAFFRGLAAGTRLTLAGDARRAIPLHLLRLGAAVAGFTLAAVFGGAAGVLGMLAGFQAAKEVVVRRAS